MRSINNPILCVNLREQIEQHFPSLIVEEVGGTIHIFGPFSIDHEGKQIDSFEIDISIPEDYPFGVPAVRERLGRIPKNQDRHVNENGTLCLFVEDEREWVYPTGATLVEFLNGPVRSHLLYQLCEETGATWEHGQRPGGHPKPASCGHLKTGQPI